MSPEERKAWEVAVTHYDEHVASRDLLFGKGMVSLKDALAAGNLSSDAVGKELRDVLEAATPVYRRHFWTAHDRVNRAWIGQTSDKLKMVAPNVVKRLEQLYGVPWFTSPTRVDVVWVGNRQGAYTTNGPTHVVISSGDPENTDWTSVETVFHEVSHTLVLPIQEKINRAARRPQKGARRPLARRPVLSHRRSGSGSAEGAWRRLHAVHVFDRVARSCLEPVPQAVEDNWSPYVTGKVPVDEAIAATVAAVK